MFIVIILQGFNPMPRHAFSCLRQGVTYATFTHAGFDNQTPNEKLV